MRNQDPSKTSSRLTYILSMRRIRLRTNPSSSTHENATTSINSLNKRTLYALDLNSLLISTPSVQNSLLDRARADISQYARAAQLFRRQCVWVKTLQGLAFFRRLENPMGFLSYYGRPIVTTLWTILPYRFDSSFISSTRINNQRYSCHLDGFSSSQSETYFHPTQQNLTVRAYDQ
jgi:hypothetical protein